MANLSTHDIVDPDRIWIVLILGLPFQEDMLSRCSNTIVKANAYNFCW